MRKIIITGALIFSMVGLSSGVSAETIVVDSNSNISSSMSDLKLNQPNTYEQALKTQDLIYSQTPFIKNATSGKGESEVGVFAVALPYYFNADFDSNLSSTTMTNGSNSTVRITARLNWEDSKSAEDLPSDFNFYDVTLYANGVNKGTYRFTPGSWHHADWTGVPSGAEVRFYMSKHVMTWTGASYFALNGDLNGSGAVLNP